ncbi:MAG TPA: HisA/HisF-related TIM barrel protein [Thermoplasmata archaeon]|nr:HisA/HisF-related TIM barrel protein [Thermoplasmata archaeon]
MAARRRWGPEGIAACARCGSRRVHPKLLVMGPIPGIDSDAYSYICEDCKYEAMPVIFDTEAQRAQFQKEIRERGHAAADKPLKTAPSVPILPIYTEPLVDVPLLDQLPVRSAAVVGVRWDGQRLVPNGYRVSFPEYWNVIGGSRYNASLVFMLDLTGIERSNPNFDVMRHLVKRCDVWLDLGVRDSDDIMDGYMLDVERVVVSTKTLPSLDAFTEAYALSPAVLPCLDWDGKVLWADPREVRTDVREVLRALRAVGYSAVCVMDLRRLGTEAGPDADLLRALEGSDLAVHVGGGVQETDVPALQEKGFAGGLVDPFTPVIRNLLLPPKDEGPAPASTPEAVARPAPSPRAVPDAG